MNFEAVFNPSGLVSSIGAGAAYSFVLAVFVVSLSLLFPRRK